MKTNRKLALIPAAGFGRRVGFPESKEMMAHPLVPGKTFIEVCLETCWRYQIKTHVITRPEKKSLIYFLKSKQSELKNKNLNDWLSFQLINSSQEWPETLLLSQTFWQEKNFIMLPDTSFEPLHLLDEMSQELSLNWPLGIARHWVENPESWGIIKPWGEEFTTPPSCKKIIWEKGIEACEKPLMTSSEKNKFPREEVLNKQRGGNHSQTFLKNEEFLNESFWAWGVLAFHFSIGENLLNHLLQSTLTHKSWIWEGLKSKFFLLDKFEDHTR